MSFIGKEYAFVKQENFEELVNTLGLTPEQAQGFINKHPNQKLSKDGDNYTLVYFREVTFKSGVEFEEEISNRKAQTTFTLDGNTLTQVQKFDDGIVFTTVRVFTDDELVVTLSYNKYDGKAIRYYKAI
ncbi:unnamed protein product [Arctia plantaginis]|uniref:Uncharacterized protein n=1 Tax=Arctia plantaginis TaxID=874455 RepID=A0A8S1AG90_ARCPL|nr:unnamed protein product [Arctia plantaginis]CAB3245682.1 unnamed protein product [Arctia plantaginis]